MIKIALIPIDNRPVCATLPKQIVECSKDYTLLLPDRNLLGGLTKIADIDGIFSWLKNIGDVDYIILSLDTLAYGGLVSSRRSAETFEDIEKRLNILKNILMEKHAKILAFSSIMRISNNNYNEEEKEYWSLFGKKIFDYSFNLHKSELIKDFDAKAKFDCISNVIPSDILEDYLSTRRRNFEVNKIYLQWMKEGLLSDLIYSKDDCAQYGLNVKEANILQSLTDKNNLNALIKTGADEIPISLLSRVFTENKNISVAIRYTQPGFENKISKYEDLSLDLSVKSQLHLAGLNIAEEEDADIILLVNNFKNEQGEIVMGVYEEGFSQDFNLPEKPYSVADVLNANGADNLFVSTLLGKNINEDLFLGYSAWNTTGNTLGTAIAVAVVKYLSGSSLDFKKLQMTRFLDDWAYQANVRQIFKNNHSDVQRCNIKEEMHEFEDILSKKFDINCTTASYSFPWNRFFEVEVQL